MIFPAVLLAVTPLIVTVVVAVMAVLAPPGAIVPPAVKVTAPVPLVVAS